MIAPRKKRTGIDKPRKGWEPLRRPGKGNHWVKEGVMERKINEGTHPTAVRPAGVEG